MAATRTSATPPHPPPNILNGASRFIGVRYLTANRRHRFGGIVRVFSFLSLFIGVAALILVLSVMNGFSREIGGRFQQVLPQLTVLAAAGTRLDSAELEAALPQVDIAPTWEDYVVLAAGRQISALTLVAVDPLIDPLATSVPDILAHGSWEAFAEKPYQILIGMHTANRLGLDIGDRVRVNFPAVRILPSGVYPLARGFEVAGIFQTRSQVDGDQAFVRVADSEALFSASGGRSGFRIDADVTDDAALGILASSQSLELIGWEQRLQGLFEAMRMEKMVVGAMLVMVVFIASFSLVASLLMSVAEKRKDIAVLRTMGATGGTILGIFLIQTMAFGGIGVALGALVGSLLSIYFGQIVGLFESLFGFRIFDPSVFYVSSLPTHWLVSDLLLVCSVSLLICLMAAAIPVWFASRVRPAEALQDSH